MHVVRIYVVRILVKFRQRDHSAYLGLNKKEWNAYKDIQRQHNTEGCSDEEMETCSDSKIRVWKGLRV